MKGNVFLGRVCTACSTGCVAVLGLKESVAISVRACAFRECLGCYGGNLAGSILGGKSVVGQVL